MRKLKEKLFLKEYDEEKIKIANKTARASGASALNKDGSIRSVVGRYVLDNVSKDASILDFGSGPAAVQTLALRDAGFKNVSAYDFGVNTRDGIQDPDALNKKYDVVFASNVLNVSSDEEMLRETLRDIKKAAKNEIVFNYPSSPRKSGLNAQEVKDIIIDEYGVEPELVSGTKSAPVWKVLLNNSKNISEDTVKTKDGKWVNRGDSGETHGEFRTKKQADAQRKAIYASGWKKESVEDLANRVRKNDLEWDDEIEASYAEDGDVAVQFQDRETLTHEVTPYRSRRPRVSSNTWGRIWKNGDLVYNERGPKYKVRDDIIKKLNSMNESFESDLERKLVRMWFNEKQAAWLVKHDPETAEWLAYGNIRTQDLIDVEQEINQKMAVKKIKESSKSLREFKDTKIDATLDADTPFTNYEVGKLLGIPAKDLLWEVEPNGAGYNPNFRDYIMKDKNGNSYNIRRMLESAPKSDSPKSLKEGRSIKDIDREILRLLEPTSLGVYISRYYEFETTKSGRQRLLNIYAPDYMDSFEFNSIRRDVRRVLGNRSVYWNSDDGLIIVDVTSFYKKSDASEESLNESEESSSEFYGVFEKGGSIGKSYATRDDLHAWSGRDAGTLVKVFSSSDEAKNYAKRMRSRLSPGERSYYGMGYFVKKLSKKDLEHPQVIDMISNMPGSSASQVDKESLNESDDVWSTPESAAKSLFDRGLVASDYVERACKRHGKDQNFAYEVGVIISQLIEEDEHLGESKSINEDIDGTLNKLGGPETFRSELMATIEAYPGIEDDIEELADMMYGSYKGVISIEELESAIEYMIDDVLESTESVNSSYSPDLLNDLVNYYSSLDTMSYEEIWDEIVLKYNNEYLANDVIESLDNDEEDSEDEFLGESKSINEDMSEEDYDEFFSIVDKIGPAINAAGGDMDDINGNLSHPYEDEDRIKIVFVSTVDKKDTKKFVKTVEAEIEKALQTTRFNRVRDIYVYQLSGSDLQMRVPASLRSEFSKKFSMFEIDIRASADL